MILCYYELASSSLSYMVRLPLEDLELMGSRDEYCMLCENSIRRSTQVFAKDDPS